MKFVKEIFQIFEILSLLWILFIFNFKEMCYTWFYLKLFHYLIASIDWWIEYYEIHLYSTLYSNEYYSIQRNLEIENESHIILMKIKIHIFMETIESMTQFYSIISFLSKSWILDVLGRPYKYVNK